MEDKKKSFEQFVEVEMKKTPEQIEEAVLADPAYPRLTPSPKTYDKLMARIAVYEAEKVKTEEEQQKERDQALAQLSEDDKEALRLGRELLARQKDAEERGEKTEEVSLGRNEGSQSSSSNMVRLKKGKKKKKAYFMVAAAIVCVFGLGITAMGGPDTVINSMTGTFGGREQSRVDSEDSMDTVISGENDEEKAYQSIKDKLGFDVVRPVYLPNGYYFKSIETSEETQMISIVYTNGTQNLFYLVQAYYINNKSGFDVEDLQVNEYDLVVDGKSITISEYRIDGVDEKEYKAEFTWRDISYRLIGTLPQDKFEEIVKNLHFA